MPTFFFLRKTRGFFLDGTKAPPSRRRALVPAVAALVLFWILPVFSTEPIDLSRAWKFHPGDNPAWAAGDFDDRDWETIPLSTPRLDAGTAVGWYRLTVASETVDGLGVLVAGRPSFGYALYANGVLIGTDGITDPNLPAAFVRETPVFRLPRGALGNNARTVLALRVRRSPGSGGADLSGTSILIGEFRDLARRAGTLDLAGKLALRQTQIGRIFELLLSVIVAAGGVYHLLLFQRRANRTAYLWFGLLALCFSADTAIFGATPWTAMWFDATTLLRLGIVFTHVTAAGNIQFSWPFLGKPIGRGWRAFQVFLLAAAATALLPLDWRVTRWSDAARIPLYLISVIGIFWLFAAETRRRTPEARPLLVGVFLSLLTIVNLIVGGSDIPAIRFITPTWGFFAIVVSMAVAISNRYGRLADELTVANRDLENKIVEIERLSAKTIGQERREAELRLQQEQERAAMAALEAENARRMEELEEARQLQLSMLPATFPTLALYEIAAHMKTATEVGGDYYDFQIADDGTLTVVIGDATGHGLRAGTVVTATKSLFEALAGERNIPDFFQTSSRALRRMNLQGTYMALTMLKLSDDRLIVSAAGMPPLLLYRAHTRQVEEILIGGLPLGGRSRFPYEQIELSLLPGDTVLLMSDGFPERSNAENELLDYPRVKAAFEAIAAASPAEIISRLVEVGETWANGRPADDDTTFVVVRRKVDRPGVA